MGEYRTQPFLLNIQLHFKLESSIANVLHSEMPNDN
jgi:hypothetical protein